MKPRRVFLGAGASACAEYALANQLLTFLGSFRTPEVPFMDIAGQVLEKRNMAEMQFFRVHDSLTPWECTLTGPLFATLKTKEFKGDYALDTERHSM